FVLSGDETKILKAMAFAAGTTIFMVLLSVLNTLLAKLQNHEDIIIGTPVAGRRHADLEKIIGMFVNTLALRNFPKGEKTFKEFLQEVKVCTLDGFENQEYQFEELVENVLVNRDTGRNPIFDIMFALYNEEEGSSRMPGAGNTGTFASEIQAQYTPGLTQQNISKFDMTIHVNEQGETLACAVEYCTKLFKRETILRFIAYFERIISIVTANPNVPINGIQVMSGEEKKRILVDYNDTAVSYPEDKPIHLLFQQQAAKSPHYIAISGCTIENVSEAEESLFAALTYQELNKRSDRLAGALMERGVVPETIVGIVLERSIEMVVGVLGILKAGGSYLPIAANYPVERKRYLLKDADVKLLLTTRSLSEEPALTLETIYLEDHVRGADFSGTLPEIPSTGLAYVIYTSGSTGTPKGVLVEHRNVVRLVKGSHFIEFNA
ncbi:MAG: AMP-binding protein, partial [bacterium]|nr:AMP-binding protein [bacterium]